MRIREKSGWRFNSKAQAALKRILNRSRRISVEVVHLMQTVSVTTSLQWSLILHRVRFRLCFM